MPLWGKQDRANNAPKWKSVATGSSIPHRGANVGGYSNNLWANVTSGAFINGTTTGLFGLSQDTGGNEVGAIQPASAAPGWNYVTIGTGPVTSVGVFGGVGFTNGAVIVVSNGSTNSTVTVTTNAAGNLSTTSVLTTGAGFLAPQVGPGTITTTITSTTLTGVGTNFVAGLIGRQIHSSSNVYIGTITAVGSVTSATLHANAAVAVTGGGYEIGLVNSFFTGWATNIANATGGSGVAGGAFPGAAQISYVNGNIITITGGVVNIANATGGSGVAGGAFPGAAQVGYTNANIITVTGSNVLVPAVANISSTNATGGNITLTIVQRGSLANGSANGPLTYAISNTGLGGGVLGNTSVTMFANAIVQTVFASPVANISSTNNTGGNITLTITQPGGILQGTANQPLTYTITRGTGSTLGNTSVTMFTNTVIANASSNGVVTNITLGGRAGRINRETLVYVRSMANNAASGGGSTPPR
jgi:hypothetical protein